MEIVPLIIGVSNAPAGPNWTDILTAIGTVATALVAVGIALWTERRSERRIRGERAQHKTAIEEERAYSRTQIEEERALQKIALAGERALQKVALEDERAYGRAEVEEERRVALEREQLAQAHAVQVVFSHSLPYPAEGKPGAV